MRKSRVVRWVDVLTCLLIAIGVTFTTYVLLFAHIDLAAVRTGPLVAIAGAVVLLGALIVGLEVPLVLFVLLRRPGNRLRVVSVMIVGLVLFALCIAIAEKYSETKLPPKQTSTPT